MVITRHDSEMLIAALLAATAVIFFARHKRKRKKRARFAERRRLVLVVVDMQKDYDTTADCELYGEVRSPYANDIAPLFVEPINRVRASNGRCPIRGHHRIR